MRKIPLLALITLAACPGLAHAVCRVIEPAVDSGVPPVAFDPTTAVLFAVNPEFILGYRCAEGIIDSPRCADGTYGEELKESRVFFAAQPRLRPSVGRAALIMPVPRGAIITRGAPELISSLAEQTRGWVDEVVTYVEDPSLGVQCTDPHYSGWGGSTGGFMPCTPGSAPPMPFPDAGTAPDAGSDAGSPSDAGSLSDAGSDAGSLSDAGSDAGSLSDAGSDAGSDSGSLSDAGSDAGPPSDIPDPSQIPVIDEYRIEIEPTLDLTVARLVELELPPRDADLAALAPYAETHDFVIVIVEPVERPGIPLVALRPIVASWPGEEMTFMEQLLEDPFGGLAVTQSYVLAERRVGREDLLGTTVFTDVVTLPTGVADLTQLSSAWLTRIDDTRLVAEPRADTRFVASTAQRPLIPRISRTRTVRIASACCPDRGVPSMQRRFLVERSYPADEPPNDAFFYCAPPPEAAACGGSPSDPWSSDPADDDYVGCGYEPAPPTRRRSGCCGGCTVGGNTDRDLQPLLLFLALTGLVYVRIKRRRG